MTRALRRVADAALEATVVGSFTSIGYEARRRLWHWEDPPKLSGREIVITGATSGLGEAAATRLAALGAHLWIVGRDAVRTQRAAERIASRSEGTVDHALADLGELDQVRALVDELTDRTERIDALIHNAGALLTTRRETSQGIEVTVASQVLGPFLLTAGLLPVLDASPGARVITVSSGGMYTERLDVDDLEMAPADYDGATAYARAKRAQVVLNREWARRHGDHGVAFHAMHPGWADTPGVEESLPTFHRVMGPLLRTPAQGADTIVWLAAAHEPLADSGELWLDRRVRRTVYLPWTRTPAGEAEHLWSWVVERSGAAPLLARAGNHDATRV